MTTEISLLEPTKDLSVKQRLSTDGQEQNLSSNQNFSGKLQKEIESISMTLKPLFEIYETVKQEIQESGTEPRYKTGLTELDKAIWGVHKKELLTIGGRTSHGKTALALHITKELSDVHNRIIYLSLEMSKEELVRRLLSNFAHINNLDIREGKAKKQIMNVENLFVHWIENIKLLIDDKYGFCYGDMVKVCEIIKPDFVVVDHIQMISTKGFRNKLEAIEEYVRRLKQLSIEMNFGTILLSQINREGIEEANMSHLKWAGVLEEHSDTVLLVSWKPTENDKCRYFIKVAKQRHGATGDNVQVKFLPQYSKFEDRDEV